MSRLGLYGMNQPNSTHAVQLYEKMVYKLVYNILFNTIKFKVQMNKFGAQ